MAIVASGVVGLAVGSFLNVVAHRLPRGMSVVRPASHCPACAATLGPVDTVPVLSWLVLRGRCRHCGAPVSPRYPIVEAATGAMFAGLVVAVGGWHPLPSLAVVAASTVAAVLIDGQRSAVPPAVTLAADLGALSLIVVAVVAGEPGRIAWALLGAVVASVAAVLGDLPWARKDTAAPRRRRRRRRERPGAGVAGPGPMATVGGLLLAGRWAVVGTLGWSAGLLWPPGGPLVAAWVLIAALGHRLRGPTALRWPLPLGVLAAGGLGTVLAAAVVGWR